MMKRVLPCAALAAAVITLLPPSIGAEPTGPARPAAEPRVVAATPAPTAASTTRWIAHPDRPFDITATEVTVGQFRACVEAGACDQATVNDACNYTSAGREDHPVNCVTYHGAEQYCRHAGGRICSEPEWLDACSGPGRRAFPYGASFDAAACNVSPSAVATAGGVLSTVPVASLETCSGGLDGLSDMAGNVAEWVADCKGDYCKFRGAGYLSNEPVDRFAGCSGVCSGNDKSLQSGVVGIRCCRDRP